MRVSFLIIGALNEKKPSPVGKVRPLTKYVTKMIRVKVTKGDIPKSGGGASVPINAFFWGKNANFLARILPLVPPLSQFRILPSAFRLPRYISG